MRLPVLIALAALSATPAVSAQQVYKWKDADGVTHYSASPPPKEVEAQKMMLRGGTASISPDAPAEGDAAAAEGSTTAAGGLSSGAMREREAACITAQANAQKLANNPYITMDKDGDGNSELLTPEEHSAQLQRAQRYAAEVCPRETPAGG